MFGLNKYDIERIAPVTPFTMQLSPIIGPIGRNHHIERKKNTPKTVERMFPTRDAKASFFDEGPDFLWE